MTSQPALMYHDIVAAGAEDASGFPGRDAARYKITPELFGAHLAAIRGLRPPVTAADAHEPRRPSPPRAPAMTFDDGGVSALAAADALERHGLTGYFFVTVDYIGAPGFLDAADIRALRGRGHVIGSHSCSHPLRMAHCAAHQLLDEWTRSRDVLSGILGEAVATASVPGGDFADAVADAAVRAGYHTLFTSEPTSRTRVRGGLAIRGRYTIWRWTTPRTAAALAEGGWIASSRQAAMWSLKKMGKRVAGPAYLTLRRRLLRHGNEVAWGDRTFR